ncbi:hypothetical protein B0H17DRAFT_1192449 [Mycena rosella]|uniref:Uncharacterized protein n=1 Tax=Mycena rosella TaxID=1033263 RepID=A0AAD7M9G6_MYCRO|nr:hypothetical protein B0H17DRAFT_1192449 [Mycena rosella]
MRVIPCSVLDIVQRDVVLTTGLVADARLDPGKIQRSLTALVEHTLCRVHCGGIFEAYLAPGTAHPDILALANRTDSEPVFCQSPGPQLRRYLVSPTCLTSTAGFVGAQTPMVHVRVAVFDDLTLVGVTASRMMFDAPGLGTLLRAC